MQESNRIVSKLYFIRSLLSQIHEYSDEITLLETSIKKLESSTASPHVQSNNISELKKQIAQEEIKLYQLKRSSSKGEKKNYFFNPRVSWIKNRINQIDSEIRDKKPKYRINHFIALFCVIVTLSIGLLWVKNSALILYGFIFGAWVLLSGFLLLLLYRKGKIEKEKEKTQIDRLNKERNTLEAEAREIYTNYQTSLKSQESYNETDIWIKIIGLKNQLAREEAREEAKSKQSAYEQVKNKIEKTSNQIYSINKKIAGLNNLISVCTQDFIDQRDLKYLDFIIYYIETKRADTIKEALQQTDLHIRHNEIIGMMKTVTTAICSTIQSSIDSLSFSLQSQLGELHSELMQNNSALSDMSEKFDNLISAQELNNALLKKANVSSEKLVENLDYLKERREYQYHLTGV